MAFETLVAIISGIVLIGGLGWKLSSELSGIRIMLQVFMAEAKAKWNDLDKLEKRIEKIENKLEKKED
jgi:hypothetical protein